MNGVRDRFARSGGRSGVRVQGDVYGVQRPFGDDARVRVVARDGRLGASDGC